MERISRTGSSIQPDLDTNQTGDQNVQSGNIASPGFDQMDAIETVVDPKQAAANQVQQKFQDQFKAMASDKQKFHELMKQVYGESYNADAA